MDKHVDFAALGDALDRAAPRPSRARGGRPAFATELMVRAVIVQQPYNLSDEQMAYRLLDRLSFQRFVGVRRSSHIPERTTFRVFRERLVKAGKSDTLFDAVHNERERRKKGRRCWANSSMSTQPSQPLRHRKRSPTISRSLGINGCIQPVDL